MSKLVRFVNHSLKDFFISNVEDSCDNSNQFKDCSPYPFADCDFKAILVCQPEEFSDCLISLKTFDDRKDIVLQSNQGSACNLGCKVVRLAFSKTKQSLAFIYDLFLGVY